MQESIDYSRQPGLELVNNKTKNNNKPIISIVTAYYNASKYIMQTAYSIINQSISNWEWIIVNDGSTEENANEMFTKLSELDNRIKIYHKENEGPAIARDYGISKANCEYICIIDSDDLLDKTFLECAYWSLITNPKASWAYSNQIAFGEDYYVWKPKYDTKTEKHENIIPSCRFSKKTSFSGRKWV